MTHYYGMGPWPTSWAASGDVSTGYPGASAQYAGWSTSWDDIMGDSARAPRKNDVNPQKGVSVNANNGFASDAAVAANLDVVSEKAVTSYHELLPGQTWDSVLPSATAHKPVFSHSTSSVLPNASVALVKPAAAPASYGWVEVTSSEGWTASTAAGGPTTPTKVRPKGESPTSPSHGLVHSPSGPGISGNNKRHRDIEDELGHQDRYKTELCRSWHESGACRYGAKCQFAHGAHELRPVMRHPKYKTEPCRSWVETRTCPYGRRCRFIHSDTSPIHQHAMQSAPGSGFPAPDHTSISSLPPPSSDYSPSQMHGLSSPASIYSAVPHSYYEHPQRAHSLPNAVSPSTGPTPHAIAPPPRFSESSYAHVPQHAYQQQMQHLQQQQHGQQIPQGQNQLYSGLGFGMPVFNGSPPLSLNSREHITVARASNAPWLSDTYQEDDTDEYDPLSESLRLTPLIEQLNLHAEPVSPTTPHVPTSTAVSRPAPIGSAPNGARVAAAPSPTSASQASHNGNTSSDTVSTDAGEKSKKKKGSRLNIFQRLSSK